MIFSLGGWKVNMNDENLDEEYETAIVEGVNINTYEFFAPLLESIPHLSLGLRWEPLHGEAWRFADLEMLLAQLTLHPETFQNWKDLDEHRSILESTYLNAPQLSQKSKDMLKEKMLGIFTPL